MFYTGERPPQIYWTKLEQQLNTAFATYVKVEGRIVHSDIMKLTHLMTKMKCDSLNAVTAALTVAIQGNPKYTYAMALKVYKAGVEKSGTSEQMRNNCQIRGKNQDRDRGFCQFGGGFGRGRGQGGGRGGGRAYSVRGRDNGRGRGYHGRGELQQIPRTVDGSRFFNLSDGTRIEYYPSITYPPHIFNKFSREE